MNTKELETYIEKRISADYPELDQIRIRVSKEGDVYDINSTEPYIRRKFILFDNISILDEVESFIIQLLDDIPPEQIYIWVYDYVRKELKSLDTSLTFEVVSAPQLYRIIDRRNNMVIEDETWRGAAIEYVDRIRDLCSTAKQTTEKNKLGIYLQDITRIGRVIPCFPPITKKEEEHEGELMLVPDSFEDFSNSAHNFWWFKKYLVSLRE